MQSEGGASKLFVNGKHDSTVALTTRMHQAEMASLGQLFDMRTWCKLWRWRMRFRRIHQVQPEPLPHPLSHLWNLKLKWIRAFAADHCSIVPEAAAITCRSFTYGSMRIFLWEGQKAMTLRGAGVSGAWPWAFTSDTGKHTQRLNALCVIPVFDWKNRHRQRVKDVVLSTVLDTFSRCLLYF